MTRKKWMIGVAGLALAVMVGGCSGNSGSSSSPAATQGTSSTPSSSSQGSITITGKLQSEETILAQMLGQLVEDKLGLTVHYKTSLGGTNLVFQALRSGDADVYVEYTGTGLVDILHQPVIHDPQQAYDTVKTQFLSKYQLVWLDPIGFNNTYSFTMRAADAQKYSIHTVSDLAKHPNQFILGSEPEFLERPDGLPGAEKAYPGLHFKATKAMDPGLMYTAIAQKQVDVIDAYTTDARIIAEHLQVLQDDKNFFPPYYAAPLVRQQTLERYPGLKEVLNSLAGKIDDREMATLNGKVDIEHQDPAKVAHDWLVAHGLL